MDAWKFFDITHRDHVVCDPTSIAKLDELIGLLDLPPRARVLDVAAGKGEFLVRVAERYEGVRGVAIDISPFCVRDLRGRLAARVPGTSVEVLEMDGAGYRAEPESFDLAACIGASWVYGGYHGTLRYLADATRPGGLVLAGEPFWRQEPDPAYLEAEGLLRDEFGTHAENVAAGVEIGLVPHLSFVSNGDEWDRYQTLQWRAAARYAAANPDDPDVPELLERVRRSREGYLRWGRDTLGWALYLFAKPR